MNTAPMSALIGHRGLPILAPENTAASIRSASEHDIQWLELDVTMAGDGSLVIMHDPDCRLFNAPEIKLVDLDANALKALDAGSWFDSAFDGEPVLFFDQMLELIRQYKRSLNLEIKINPDIDVNRQVDAIWQGLSRATDLFDQILISSFSIDALKRLRHFNQTLKVGVLFESVPDDAVNTAILLKASSIHCDQALLSETTAKHLVTNFPTYCYTVNDTNTLEKLLSWGVSGVFSDRAHAQDLAKIAQQYR